MGGVADAEQAGTRPVAEVIDGDGEEFDVAPIFEFVGATAEKWSDRFKFGAKGGQTFFLDSVEGAFGDDVGALPVVAAIDGDKKFS